MNKNTFYAIFLIVACGLGLNFWINASGTKDLPVTSSFVVRRSNAVGDYKNIAYVFDGEPVLLKNGFASVPAAPGSASFITTRYFGNEARADLNGDGKQDIVFLLTRETGGSGIFYYVAAAMSSQNGYVGSVAYYIGDRIAPQPINIDERNTILVNYADRKPGESFAIRPSLGKTLRLKIDPKTLHFGIGE